MAMSFWDFVRAGLIEWICEAEGFWKGPCWHGQHACETVSRSGFIVPDSFKVLCTHCMHVGLLSHIFFPNGLDALKCHPQAMLRHLSTDYLVDYARWLDVHQEVLRHWQGKRLETLKEIETRSVCTSGDRLLIGTKA